MRKLLRTLGTVAFWSAWPLYPFYFRRGDRTRVLLTQGSKVLVVTNWVSDGKWSLPGGGLHKGELPLPGAVRELHEEIGLLVQPEQLQLLGKGEYRAYGHHYHFYCYTLEVNDKVAIKKQLHEIADARWMDYRELNARNAAPDVLLCLGMWLNR